jgi:opacity protein-like surface antigen
MNGATIGGGEQQIVHGWTVKVEGRYTKFATKNVTNSFTNTFSSSSGGTNDTNVSTLTSTNTNVTNATERFSASMASILIGVSYYFGSY